MNTQFPNVIHIFSRRQPETEYLSVREASLELSISTSTVYRRIKRLGICFQNKRNGRMLTLITRAQLIEISLMSKRKALDEATFSASVQVSAEPLTFRAHAKSEKELDETIAENQRLLQLMELKKRFRMTID